jgi:hypothetical protein
MTTSTLALPPRSAVPGRALGLMLVAEALLSFAPLLVLGPAIGWPASLGRPPAEQMAAIAAAPGAVALGYALYLLYSVAVAPVMIGLAARTFGSLAHPAAAAVAAFAALSALARSIGILRWLTAMPALAAAHAGADPAQRAAIESLFAAVNAWGGGIGELLGVSLFMALALGTLAAGGWRRLPRGLAASGCVTALALAAIPADLPVAVAVSALSAWMLAAGVWCLRRPVSFAA